MKTEFRLRLAIMVAAVSAAPLLWAAKEFSMPKVRPAFSYPARDHHGGTENITVALDPYDTPEKASIFLVHYRELGLLPVMLIITNDSEQPIQLSKMKAQLVAADRSKLSPASEEDLYRRISHPSAAGARTPLPFPTKRVKGVDPKQLNEILSAQFKAHAVEPRGTQAGFLFFDVSDVSDPLVGARFYLTGVRDSSGNELMYFEVPLDQASKTSP